MVMAAAICSLVLGLGFGLPAIVGTRHLAATGEIWTFLGFPTYGGGPFERLGLPTSVALMIGFVLVCAAEVAVGVMLLLGAPHAATVSYLLLPLEFVFWIGFALRSARRSVSLERSCWCSPDALPPLAVEPVDVPLEAVRLGARSHRHRRVGPHVHRALGTARFAPTT